jgi:hypothetical protein
MRQPKVAYNTLVINFNLQGFTLGFNVRERERNHLSKLLMLHDFKQEEKEKLNTSNSSNIDMRMSKDDDDDEDDDDGERRKDLNLDDEELKRLNTAQTDLIGYDENEILFYVNCGEIPPVIIDILDRVNVSTIFNLFI